MALLRKKYKHHRRLGVNIHGTPKSPIIKRNSTPGQHGRRVVRRPSDYGLALLEVQKMKHFYGYIPTFKLKALILKSIAKGGNTASTLVTLLETKLSTLVYRSGIARTIFHARQLVSHGHVAVNGEYVYGGSFCHKVKVGDRINIRPDLFNNPNIQEAIAMKKKIPSYITHNGPMEFVLNAEPTIETTEYPVSIDVAGIIKFLRKR